MKKILFIAVIFAASCTKQIQATKELPTQKVYFQIESVSKTTGEKTYSNPIITNL